MLRRTQATLRLQHRKSPRLASSAASKPASRPPAAQGGRRGARLSSRLRVVNCPALLVIDPTHDQPLYVYAPSASRSNTRSCRDPGFGVSHISWRTRCASPDGGQWHGAVSSGGWLGGENGGGEPVGGGTKRRPPPCVGTMPPWRVNLSITPRLALPAHPQRAVAGDHAPRPKAGITSVPPRQRRSPLRR